MTGIRSHAGQLSLSVAGIMVLVLFAGAAFVPQELRADAASRIVDIAQYFDTAFADAWHSAFPSSGSDSRAGASPNHKGSIGSHPGTPLVLTGAAVPPSTSAVAGLIDVNGLGRGSINAGYGADSASNSMASLLSDILKEDSLGAVGGFEAFARSAGGGIGNNPAGSGGAGDRHSGGTGVSTGGGAGRAGLSRSSSSKDRPASSTPSSGRNSKGTLRFTDVKPDAHDAGVISDAHDAHGATSVAHDVKPDTHDVRPNPHQDRVAGLGTGLVSVSDTAGASWKQVASSESLNGHFGGEPWVSDSSGGPHEGGAGNALDPATGDPVEQLLNGLDDPLQGHNPGSTVFQQDPGGSVFQNDVSGGADSNGGDGRLLDFTKPANDPQIEDHGPFNKPILPPGVDSGPVSSVPEPRSLALLSLGLGVIILWRQFRPTR